MASFLEAYREEVKIQFFTELTKKISSMLNNGELPSPPRKTSVNVAQLREFFDFDSQFEPYLLPGLGKTCYVAELEPAKMFAKILKDAPKPNRPTASPSTQSSFTHYSHTAQIITVRSPLYKRGQSPHEQSSASSSSGWSDVIDDQPTSTRSPLYSRGHTISTVSVQGNFSTSSSSDNEEYLRQLLMQFFKKEEIEKEHLFCSFCLQNREQLMFCATHMVRSKSGIVTCPILRKHVCTFCGATGDFAHTNKHCPFNPNPTNQARTANRNAIGRTVSRYYTFFQKMR